MIVPAGDTAVAVRFTAIHMAAPEALRFRYRVTPGDNGVEADHSDDDWTPVGRSRRIVLRGLPAGRHTFEVRASLDGKYATEGATATLDVEALFWQRPGFIAASGAAAAAAVAAVVLGVVRQRYRRRLSRERELQQERERIARDIHDGADTARSTDAERHAHAAPRVVSREVEQDRVGEISLATHVPERRRNACAQARFRRATRRELRGVDRSGRRDRVLARGLRELRVTPHVARNHHATHPSAIDGRTTWRPGYAVSLRVRKRIEEIFGWCKTVGGLRKSRYRGVERTGLWAYFTTTAYNLVRMAKLMPGLVPA
jgi:uncharacterized protein with FMN-binding domain